MFEVTPATAGVSHGAEHVTAENIESLSRVWLASAGFINCRVIVCWIGIPAVVSGTIGVCK